MIGAQVGPYRVVSELGAGGMGAVYLAEVTETTPLLGVGERIALKIVHPHLLATPGFFKRFLQEAEVGKRIQHPNVVRTYEVDATLVEDKQVNYMAMEYVEGRSLRQLLIDLGTVPETLLREIASQIAAGLQAIHDGGIVHRDLKPENVLITDGQQVRIMDLGVAKLQEASIALTREGQFTGSLLYAAPEQCEAKDVTASADLYALGVMLYELATGTNPFRRDDPVAIIKAHISHEPQRASDLNPGVSLFFTELIKTLMAKQPEERIASAAELGQVLEASEESDWWGEREQHLHTIIAELPAIQVGRETDIHGRVDEMALLAESWQKAKDGQGNAILLEGEAGLGKSRLVDAFMRSLAGQDAHVLYGSYPPSGGIGGISDAVIGRFGSSQLQESLAPYLTVTPSLIPAFAALLRHESPPTGTESLQGDALHSVCCHLMRGLAAEAPTLWILDDLHFAPVESRRVVLAMARALAPHRVLMVMTARPGIPEDDVAHFSRLEHFRKATLGRLGAREVIELLQDLFKSEALAEKLGGKIAYKSDGVPFFVIELVRGLKDGSLLKQMPNGSYVQTQQITDIEVPSAVKDLIAGRLRELSKEERAILDIGAVQGFEFDPDLVARVRESKRVHVLETLADLERTRGVVRGVGRKYRFDQNQIHEVVISEISEPLREEYHKLIAEAFIEREDMTPEEATGEEAVFVAQHLFQGDTPKHGRRYLEPALDHLAALSRHGALVSLANMALPHVRGPEKVQLLTRTANGLGSQLRSDEQAAAIVEAVELAEQLEDPTAKAIAYEAQGNQFRQRSNYEEGCELSKKAAHYAHEIGDRSRESSIHNTIGNHCWHMGRFDEANRAWRQAVDIARESGNRSVESLASGNLGYSAMAVGRYADALDRFEDGLRVRREINNRRTEANGEQSLGIIRLGLGDLDGATESLERAISLAQEVGDPHEETYALQYLGEALAARGDVDRAMEKFRRTLSFRTEMGWTSGQAETRLRIGVLELARGRTSQAIEQLDQAIELSTKSQSDAYRMLAISWRSLLPEGNAETARRAIAEFSERAEWAHRMEARYVLWKATGEREQIETAHEMLAHLQAHAPEEYRETLVQNVPLHREIDAGFRAL